VPEQNATTSTTGSTGSGPKRTRGQRLRYRFDVALSRGPSVVIGWLGLLTLAIIVIGAVIMALLSMRGVNGVGNPTPSFPDALWQAMLRIVDAGTFAADATWGTRLLGLLITLCGIFIAGSLIGLIASGLDQRIEELRRGRSDVIEDDHTLILGWSARVPAIVSELVLANESRKRAAVVVLASDDKTEMEDVLRRAIPDMMTTRVVCRSGEPWMPRNLEMVNLAGARSVIVIGDTDGDDSHTVKVLLAIRATIGDAGPHVVAEVSDVETAGSVRSLLGERLVTVSSDDVVAELTAQACRQRGLSAVFRELLDFDGDEIYFDTFPELVGKTYGECQLAFEKAAVLGIRSAADGLVVLNPPSDTVFRDGDQLIGVAEDDSVFKVTGLQKQATALETWPPTARDAMRRIVVAGWSDLGPRVIAELDEFMGPETVLEVLVDPDLVDPQAVRNAVQVRNVSVEVSELQGGPELIASHAARISFHEVILLGYREIPMDEADARTLLTLLAFRQVRQHEDVGPVRMVAELLDQRHAPLAVATGADDFIVSDELTSLMLAQLSERRDLHQVFVDLFDRTGCSIELREALQYGAHKASTFGDVVLTASGLGQTAIGYRTARTGDVVINPPKSAPLRLTADDEVLVLAPGLPG
jgi:Trk K+ transport system NAD-binding subunit